MVSPAPSATTSSTTTTELSKKSSPPCDACGAQNPRFSCNRCKKICYCTAECQKKAWAVHKLFCNKDLLVQDKIGFTPLHYAVLYGKKEVLHEASPEQLKTVKDSFGGTPEDLQRLMAPVPPDEAIVCKFKNQQGVEEDLTQARFSLLTGGKKFIPWFKTSRDTILQMHQVAKLGEAYIESISICWNGTLSPDDPKIREWEKNPPLLLLQEEPPMGLAVASGQDIRKGSVIGVYIGKVTDRLESSSYKESIFKCNFIDPSDISGLIPFANDGAPPNCKMQPLLRYKGLPTALCMVATQDIRKGEPLHWNYGSAHAVKGGRYFLDLQSYNSLAAWCRSGKLLPTLYQVGQPKTNKKEPEKELDINDENRLRYILSTPFALMRLVFRGDLKLKELQNLIKSVEFAGYLIGEQRTYKSSITSLYPDLTNALAKIPPRLFEKLDSFLDALTVRTCMELLLCMERDRNLSLEKVEQYKALGELFDQLYLWFNGTLTGTYLGWKTEEKGDEKKEELPLDKKSLIRGVKNLPPELQQVVKAKVKSYLEMAGAITQLPLAKGLALLTLLNKI